MMDMFWNKMERMALWLGCITIAAYIVLFGWLAFEFKHPYLCDYEYVAADGTTGIAKMCSTTANGVDYCRINAKQNIGVKDYKEVCGRK